MGSIGPETLRGAPSDTLTVGIFSLITALLPEKSRSTS